ncbi:hypothetical protein BKA62DRAFT_723906 [Auriculariales sp. MPI-PUGE-AT-0066]|nr:hypothetical protein BKA62DRAFT_723906 [Auriculariales sp. MPI-PUGE-AT-0066]
MVRTGFALVSTAFAWLGTVLSRRYVAAKSTSRGQPYFAGSIRDHSFLLVHMTSVQHVPISQDPVVAGLHELTRKMNKRYIPLPHLPTRCLNVDPVHGQREDRRAGRGFVL